MQFKKASLVYKGGGGCFVVVVSVYIDHATGGYIGMMQDQKAESLRERSAGISAILGRYRFFTIVL